MFFDDRSHSCFRGFVISWARIVIWAWNQHSPTRILQAKLIRKFLSAIRSIKTLRVDTCCRRFLSIFATNSAFQEASLQSLDTLHSRMCSSRNAIQHISQQFVDIRQYWSNNKMSSKVSGFSFHQFLTIPIGSTGEISKIRQKIKITHQALH